MLKECRTHGYFRAEDCPVCGDEGRFLMNEEELDRIGRTMAGVLRHFPERYGLTMDEQGWIDLEQFVTAVQARQRMFRWLKTHHIMAVIETDPKGRYQFREGKIRATYAHSIEVKLDLPTRDIPDVLYYPTTQEELELLLETGLKPATEKWSTSARPTRRPSSPGGSASKTPRFSQSILSRRSRTVWSSRRPERRFF
jgi:putative RNA 2'-phosphotransferase